MPGRDFVFGANHPRVAPWHRTNASAKSQAATSSKTPVLLGLDCDAGHGVGANRAQHDVLLADTWAFASWQRGELDVQPNDRLVHGR